MRKIETCLSPDLIHLHDLKNKIVVVVDIFRASSTMVTALANGVESIIPIEDLETCRRQKKRDFLIAGERNGQKAEGFDLGNSPLAYLDGRHKQKKVAMTTTNGTRAIAYAKDNAAEVLVGAFLNLEATAEYLKAKEADVLVLCAGWKGKFNLEDALYAGALSLSLGLSHDCDATLAMEALYEGAKDDLANFLKKASHAKRLQNYNIEEDIDFCLSLSQFQVVIRLENGELKPKKVKVLNKLQIKPGQ
ncbi:2-phosphosulfolactate phosphatase [Negadavirga shengliensis]|uniref:Probable 2-phosphosulfolactate phosphatase n=1 Tax=Negadavirga shengliensis TaxID=1389218 RepID=A0ABV9T7L7_9BACT